MNEILIKLEKLNDEDLSYLFEYLVELLNERKRKAEFDAKRRIQNSKRV